jgi:hypothetical protein
MATKRNKPTERHDEVEEFPEERGGVDVHAAFLEYRLGGAGDASEALAPRPEWAAAYADAIEQFERLPGAVRSTPPSRPDDDRREEGRPQ